MTSFDSELDGLSQKQRDLDSQYAHRMAKIELGKDQYQQSLDQLKDLGCSTLEDAQEKISSLQEQIQLGLTQIAKDLDEDRGIS